MAINVKDLVISNKFNPYVVSVDPRTFEGLFQKLSLYLDTIKTEAPKGKPPPPAANAPKGTTDTGAKAYGESYKKAKEDIEKFVNALSWNHIGYLAGLKFTKPADEKQTRADVSLAVLTHWDKPAAKYMKNSLSEGDAARNELLTHLREFDTAISTRGGTPVKPLQ